MLVKLLILTLALLMSAGLSSPKKRCDTDLGCFETGPPFRSRHRPISLLPELRTQINTKFWLLTREAKTNFHELRAKDEKSFTSSTFKGSRQTKFIVHGWFEIGTAQWIKEMGLELLKAGDYNVISVDWRKGSGFPYSQAAANTQLVGREIALLMKYISQLYKQTTPKSFHLIGHSLGAHISGYAGEQVKNIGRITALDPAEAYFQWTDTRVRLDPGDADFVDVIHTDAKSMLNVVVGRGGLGMIQPVGHLDFYPNGGKTQPNCKIRLMDAIRQHGLTRGVKRRFGCGHLRVRDLFTQLINSPCSVKSFACESWEKFQAGQCFDCTTKQCAKMGFHAIKPKSNNATTKLYAYTTGSKPFCGFQYKVGVKLESSVRGERGRLRVTLLGEKGANMIFNVNEKPVMLKPGGQYTRLGIATTNLGKIQQANLYWTHDSKWSDIKSWAFFRQPQILVKLIEVVDQNGKKLNFYHRGSIKEKTETTFKQ